MIDFLHFIKNDKNIHKRFGINDKLEENLLKEKKI